MDEKKIQQTMKETKQHIARVNEVGDIFTRKFKERLLLHDQSKLEEPERTMFAKHTENLNQLEYGTDDYEKEIEEMKKDCLNHHYENNSHHPEHFENGIYDMNLFDLLEMICDWKAASERTKDGNFKKSLEINMKRFSIPEPLSSIILRSVECFDNGSSREDEEIW